MVKSNIFFLVPVSFFVVSDPFGPKVVFACSSIHMIVQQQLTLRLREEVHKIHEQSLLKSMECVQCAPRKILE